MNKIKSYRHREEKELAKWFFDLVGYFNHYSFFTKKLWKKVKGFKEKDEAEIKCVFMHYWFHHEFRYYSCPVGMSWFSEVNQNTYEKYIKTYQPILDAFEKWKIEQI